MEKVKFGVIGLGRIANDFCSDLIQSENAVLYAAASRNKDKAAKFADKYNAVKSYGSYKELAHDKNVDIVYIATPHNFHKDIAIMCMNAGKAVLCEKPAGVNENELQQMIDCAKSNDVFFMEGMWTRAFPLTKKIKEIVKTKELGEVRHIEANFGFGSWDNNDINNPDKRHYSMALAGGAILDLGVYCVQLVTWLKDRAPDKIAALSRMMQSGADGNTVCIMEYTDECTATLQCSLCQNTSTEARIYFDSGKIELSTFYKPNAIKVTYSDKQCEVLTDNYEERGYNGFIYEIDHVSECIEKGLKQSPFHSWNDALEVIKILDNMRSQVNLRYPFE